MSHAAAKCSSQKEKDSEDKAARDTEQGSSRGLLSEEQRETPPGRRAPVVKTGQGARESHISVIKISLHVQLSQNLHTLITRKTTLSRLKTHRVGTDHTSE